MLMAKLLNLNVLAVFRWETALVAMDKNEGGV